MAINPEKNAVEQGLIARLIGKIKRIALDMGDSVAAETSRAQDAEASARTEVVQGENCTIERSTAADGHDVYTVNADGKPQKQTDWNQSDSSEVDYINNKPNLAAVATSGEYDDLSNKPSIPDPQVQTDWEQDDAMSLGYLKNKPTIITDAEIKALFI